MVKIPHFSSLYSKFLICLSSSLFFPQNLLQLVWNLFKMGSLDRDIFRSPKYNNDSLGLGNYISVDAIYNCIGIFAGTSYCALMEKILDLHIKYKLYYQAIITFSIPGHLISVY